MSKAYGLIDIKKALHIGTDTFYKLLKNDEFSKFFGSNNKYKHICTNVQKAQKWLEQNHNMKTKQMGGINNVDCTKQVKQSEALENMDSFVFKNCVYNMQDLIDFLNIPIPTDYAQLAPWQQQLWYRCKKYQKQYQHIHPIEKLGMWHIDTMTRTEVTKSDIANTFLFYTIDNNIDIDLEITIPGWEYKDGRFIRQ